jgi:ATP-binding cassette subfamily C (CFTR/MRP) protein 1
MRYKMSASALRLGKSWAYVVELEGTSYDITLKERLRKLTIPSGKSTLVSVLLRLVDPSSGNVTIDGVDISTVSREVIRSKIICLPQDPLLLPGTFEGNLDFDGLATSAQMQIALEEMQLWDLVKDRGGLKAEFHPDSLSNGEKQLFAIARAILRNWHACGRSILILDEATSNLDSNTEAFIQDVVRKEFEGQTIISIAHRLKLLRNCDTVVELGKGKVVRIGPPDMVFGYESKANAMNTQV